ncbi:type II secretion system protein N [Kerstersia similis]|uniref:type II secretion system protein N n=1 Tax=Kerstersia similis TaxID=206505 RepID=UPI0039F01492
MRRKLILKVIGFFLVALAAALAVMPARWAMVLLPASLPLAIVDASGSIWSGSATIAIGPEGRRRTLPDPLSWTLNWRQGPVADLRHPWLGGPVTLAPGWRGLAINAQSLRLPASTLTAFHAALDTIGPGGELQLNWPATLLGAALPPGTRLLDIQWRNASSDLTPVKPFGSYDLTVTQDTDNRVKLTLATRQGPLRLQGDGTVTRKGLAFQGTAEVEASASPDVHGALNELLAALGPRTGNQTRLNFR